MSTISLETINESSLTVDEYVRFLRIVESLRGMLEKAGIEDFLRESEESLPGLRIDIILRSVIEKKSNISGLALGFRPLS